LSYLQSTGHRLSRSHETEQWGQKMTTVETELAAARMLLEPITEGRLKMRVGGKDVTERERVLLKREIAALEKTLARTRPEGGGMLPCPG
jgi:hypothetical protein